MLGIGKPGSPASVTGAISLASEGIRFELQGSEVDLANRKVQSDANLRRKSTKWRLKNKVQNEAEVRENVMIAKDLDF